MKSQTYMDRALRAQDPRYAQILGKLGYGSRDMQADERKPAAKKPAASKQEAEDELPALRAEYQEVVGKRPFNGWNADTLREKIAAAKG